jgi:Zn-dependent protease
MINGILAVFNLLPAFPLDGGRVLRSILWGVKKNLRWATYVFSKIGSGFGILLIVSGVNQVFRGNFIGGMWWLETRPRRALPRIPMSRRPMP